MSVGLSDGCATVGPAHRPPQLSPPATWHATAVSGATDATALARWWTVLNDPLLTDLIDRALAASLDVRLAEARLREARARLGLAAADRFPTLTAAVAATGTSRETGNTTLYSSGFDASWEADVFGGRRRVLEAREASLEASVADLRDVMVSLAAEVALNYVDLRLAQARLTTANANLEAQSETYEIAQFRFQAGLTTERDVEQARLNLEHTRAQIPTLRAGLEQAKNRLTVLSAQSPGALESDLSAVRDVPVPQVAVAIGVPADVLRRRPDIRRAERQLAAQTAQIGAATANRYPSFALVGSIGLEVLSLSNLLSAAARALVAGANIGQTIFDAGRIRQNIAVQTALQEEARISYETTVLNALEEVENALVAYAEEQARHQALRNATAAARRAAALADEQYRSGLVDFQVVLDAQRSLLSLEDQLATSAGTVTSNLIRLYKALGGGWTPSASMRAN